MADPVKLLFSHTVRRNDTIKIRKNNIYDADGNLWNFPAHFSRARCQLKADLESSSVLEFDTDSGTLDFSTLGSLFFTQTRINNNDTIASKKYTGDIEFWEPDNEVTTMFIVEITIKEDYTL